MPVCEENGERDERKVPYALSLTGAILGILGGLTGVFAYFQAERLAEENAALSQRLTEASNTYVALQTRISACNEIATHHRRQAAEDEADKYIETRLLRLPNGSSETMSSNQQRFVASMTMSRALSMCLVEGGSQDLVRKCVADANSEGSKDYPKFVIDAIDDEENGRRNLAC